jgi:predicted ATPase
MCVFLGANGSGKSTLLDVFGFLSDCIAGDVRSALGRRGGFREVVSRGATDPISLTLQFRPRASDTAVVYSVAVGLRDGTPIVEYERLRSGRDERMLMDFRLGEGTAVTNERALRDGEAEQRVFQRLDTPYTLAIKGLGQFDRFPTAAALRRLMESLHRVDAHVDAGDSVTQRGETLADAARRIHEHDPAAFGRILQKMQERVPGITRIEAATTIDGRLVLGFQDEAFTDPFMDHTVSDGTIKMFAYLLLLHDPEPHPLLAIEEPENQLHPDLLMELAEEFREYAERGGQVFISTHSPDFVNGVRLDELFWLTKEQGFTKITRASDDTQLCDLVDAGDLPGALWKQQLFPGAGPR